MTEGAAGTTSEDQFPGKGPLTQPSAASGQTVMFAVPAGPLADAVGQVLRASGIEAESWTVDGPVEPGGQVDGNGRSGRGDQASRDGQESRDRQAGGVGQPGRGDQVSGSGERSTTAAKPKVTITMAFRKAKTPLGRDHLDIVHHESGPLHDISIIVKGGTASGQGLLGVPLTILPPDVELPLNFALGVRRGTQVPLRVAGSTDSGELFIYDTVLKT